MKRILVIGLCIALLTCVSPSQQDEPNAPEPTREANAMDAAAENTVSESVNEPDRFPAAENIAPLPDQIESVDLADSLLVYVSNGATYFYMHGESIFLHEGEPPASDYWPYSYLTNGTALTFIEPGDGTLRTLDLNDPHRAPEPIDPAGVNGVERFAISQSGKEILFLRKETAQSGESVEALYYYADGAAARIEQGVGNVDQFSLSLDGTSYVFYAWDEPFTDHLRMEQGEPIELDDPVEAISEDFRTALTLGSGVLTLYRAGLEPIRLSEQCELYGIEIAQNGTVLWREQDQTLWQFDGVEKIMLLENAQVLHVAESGMLVFKRDGSLYARFDDEPLLICAQEPGKKVYLSKVLDGGNRIAYSTVSETDADAYRHRTTYVVNVNRNGVSEPVLISDDNYMVLPFRDDWIVVQTEDTVTCDLSYKGKSVGVADDLWNDCFLLGDADEQVLIFRSEGKLCRFDGETVTILLDSVPGLLTRWVCPLKNGAFLYLEGDAQYCFDGTTFRCILQNVEKSFFVSTLRDALDERLIHD